MRILTAAPKGRRSLDRRGLFSGLVIAVAVHSFTLPQINYRHFCTDNRVQTYVAVNWKKKNNQKDTTFLKTNEIFIFVTRCVRVQSFSRVWLFATLWTLTLQAPLSMGLSRQEYWSGLPCLPSGDLPNPRIKPTSPAAPAFQVDSLPPSHQRSQLYWIFKRYFSLNTNCLPTKSFPAMTSFINKIKYSAQHHHPKSQLFAQRAVKE